MVYEPAERGYPIAECPDCPASGYPDDRPKPTEDGLEVECSNCGTVFTWNLKPEQMIECEGCGLVDLTLEHYPHGGYHDGRARYHCPAKYPKHPAVEDRDDCGGWAYKVNSVPRSERKEREQQERTPEEVARFERAARWTGAIETDLPRRRRLPDPIEDLLRQDDDENSPLSDGLEDEEDGEDDDGGSKTGR